MTEKKTRCKNCGKEIGEFSSDKKNWSWKHIGRLPDGRVFYAGVTSLDGRCLKPAPLTRGVEK